MCAGNGKPQEKIGTIITAGRFNNTGSNAKVASETWRAVDDEYCLSTAFSSYSSSPTSKHAGGCLEVRQLLPITYIADPGIEFLITYIFMMTLGMSVSLSDIVIQRRIFSARFFRRFHKGQRES